MGSDFNPRNRPWYKEAINNPSEIIMSEPYEDAVNKKIVITYSKVVKNDNGEIQGVVSLDKNLDRLSDMVRNMNLENNAFATVLSENGTIVAHEDASLIGKDVKAFPWIGEVQNIENNTSKNIDIDGVNYLSYKTIEDETGLSVVVFVPTQELFMSALKEMLFPLGVFIAIIILIVIVSKIFTGKLANPIREVVESLDKIKDGDFTKKVESKFYYNSEINSMVNGLNILIDDMVI